MAKGTILTNGSVLESWRSWRKNHSPTAKLSTLRPAFCRDILSTLNLVDNHTKCPDWELAVKCAARKLEGLLEADTNSRKSGKRKQVDLSEVCRKCYVNFEFIVHCHIAYQMLGAVQK